MKNTRKIFFLVLFYISFALGQQGVAFSPIKGFNEQVNKQLKEFLAASESEKGRKIAVFDGDGTVLGQVPHYLADECMYLYAKSKPGFRTELVNEMVKQSNVSLPYVQNRVKLLSGLSLAELRQMGKDCYHKYYEGKVYEPMKELIENLKKNGFEIWVVSASPEAMYQQFLSEELKIPMTNIIGVKSIIRNGVITDEIIQPVPQDKGKMEAIESFIQDKPLLVAGNSRGDKEMIEFSRGIKMIINPDTHVAEDQQESIASYAEKNKWLIVRINDTPDESHPWTSTADYKIKRNKTNEVK